MKTRWHPHLILSIVFFLLVLSGGTAVYHNVEGWEIIDSAYFVVVTVTTIGYGDIFPITDMGKIFTMFFSFFGIAFALYFISLLSGGLFSEHLNKKVGQIKRAIEKKEELEGLIEEKEENIKKLRKRKKQFIEIIKK